MTPHEQQLIDTICPAIQSHKLIRFWYENITKGNKDWRVVEPYLIGTFPRKYIQLSAWYLPTLEQTRNGQKGDWRSYILKNINQLQILDQQYPEVRDGYDPTGNGMSQVFCSLKKI